MTTWKALLTGDGRKANSIKWNGTAYVDESGQVRAENFGDAQEGALAVAIDEKRVTGDDIPDRFRKGKRR